MREGLGGRDTCIWRKEGRRGEVGRVRKEEGREGESEERDQKKEIGGAGR